MELHQACYLTDHYQVKFIVLDSPYICGLSRFFIKCCIYCLLFQRIIILYITITLVSQVYICLGN